MNVRIVGSEDEVVAFVQRVEAVRVVLRDPARYQGGRLDGLNRGYSSADAQCSRKVWVWTDQKEVVRIGQMIPKAASLLRDVDYSQRSEPETLGHSH